MTKTQFLQVIVNEGVRFYRVNGFSLSYENGAVVRGKIPLGLARKIRNSEETKDFCISFGGSYVEQPDEWATNAELADMVSEAVNELFVNPNAKEKYEQKRAEYIKKAEQTGKLDDIYILSIYVATPEGLRHIIRTIRECGYINECLWHS